MKVTALEEYGLRCMVLLARHSATDSLTLSDISAREGLSIPYAGKLLMILRKSGLVKAERGRQGGYALSRPASEISLKEIFDALGEPLFNASHCERHTGDNETCVHTDDCSVRHIWNRFDQFINNILENLSLADLADDRKQLQNNLQRFSGFNHDIKAQSN